MRTRTVFLRSSLLKTAAIATIKRQDSARDLHKDEEFRFLEFPSIAIDLEFFLLSDHNSEIGDL